MEAAETGLAPPPPEPTASPEPEILLRNRNGDRDWKADMMSALGDSVSFGRFLAEPLEWGKWSAFQHNRYLEEAAGQARPGSVAQRKAFFEDHYARKRKKSEDAGEDDDDSSLPDSSSPEEPKAVVTDGVGLPCGFDNTTDDEWSHKQKQEDAQLAESRKALQLDDGSIVVATAVADSPEKQPLQESSIVNQESISDSAKKRRLPIASSLFQKPAMESSSPPSGKKTPVKRRSSTLGSAKENSSPSPSTDSNKQQEGASVAHKRSPFGMSMNFRRCETGNPASRSRNLGTTIASRISQLESASRPVKDTHPKVNQFRQTRKGFCKGVPEIATKTSQQHERRSSHATMTRVKEKLFGSFSSPVHPKTNIATENMRAQEIPNLPNSDPQLNDAINPHVLSRGAPKDKQICCFPLRRLC